MAIGLVLLPLPSEAATVGLFDVSSSTCGLSIAGSTGTTVSLDYISLPANQAKTYGDIVALWAASVVPWSVKPAAKATLLLDLQSGSHVLDSVSIGPLTYILGYAVGPEITDICASATLNPDGSSGPTDAVTIEIVSVGATSLAIRYHTLSGYRPATAGNWIGLWAGRASPYDAPAPLARQAISGDVTDSVLALNGVPLARGSFYTLVYFMGQATTTAAALTTFRTAP